MLSWLWGKREKGREKKEQKNEKERKKTDGHREMKIRMVSYFCFFFSGTFRKVSILPVPCESERIYGVG